MRFNPTRLSGVYLIELEMNEDERGFFARTFCQDEFDAQGLNPRIAQSNISFNKHKGTLRGMHYQVAPYAETKCVRCTRGAICDVLIDLRPESATYRQWMTTDLSAANYLTLYIPEGLAHGFLTLERDTEVFYQMSEFYHPEYAQGVRWNDPAFGVILPFEPTIISGRDRLYVDYKA